MDFDTFVNFVNSIAPPALSMPDDRDGVAVRGERDIKKVLLCLDVTQDVVFNACGHGFDCIVSHHNFLYYPLPTLDGETPASRKALMLARHGIGAISAHTRFDAVEGGVNDCLLDILGVRGAEMLAAPGCPQIGRVFTLDEPLYTADFAALVKERLAAFYQSRSIDSTKLHVACRGGGGGKIQRVAMVAGNGSSFVGEAVAAGADAFLTGEMKYADMTYNADLTTTSGGSLCIVTAGHYHTEFPALYALQSMIAAACPGVDVSVWTDADL